MAAWTTVLLAAAGLAAFLLGYRFYARFLARRIFALDPSARTPAVELEDGVDFVPTPRPVLFGHHFTSIAGAGPILGPAIAVQWGWLPAFLWVVLGAIFIGAVHDLAALVISLRHQGSSIGDIAERVLGKRARLCFLLLVIVLTWVVLALFAVAIARLFSEVPGAVFPINFEIVVALAIGFWFHRRGASIFWPSLAALALLVVAMGLGAQYTPADWKLPTLAGWNDVELWVLFLSVYCFLASALPVWMLLQPRDYINSHKLFLGLGALFLGLFIARPPMETPAFDPTGGGEGWLPLLFVTVACGAVSGFHGLVSSGTTSKQLRSETDATFIGYGGMLGEGTLALVSVLACSAGLVAWQHLHGDAGAAGPLQRFVRGGAYLLQEGLGIPGRVSSVFIAVIFISFAATTLDTACRIQRFLLAELGQALGLAWLSRRWLGSALAAFSPLLLAIWGTNYLQSLWSVFGAVNQLLAALTLLVVSVWLRRSGRPAIYTLVPMVLLLALTLWSMVLKLMGFLAVERSALALLGLPFEYLLAALTALMLGLGLWIVAEGLAALRRPARET